MKTIYTYSAIVALLLSNILVKANQPINQNDIIYQLTIKSTDISKSRTVVEEFALLRKVMTQGNFEYQFGKFTNFKSADSVKTLLTDVGCSDVKVLAYNNHVLIPLTEAISLQYKDEVLTSQNTIKKVAKTITTKEVNYLIQVQQSGLKHYYSLAIPITSVETVDMILEEIGNEQVIEISADNKLYSIGNYTSFNEVIAARKQFIESKIYDVFIMAQITDDRINSEDSSNLALAIQSVVNELAAK